MTKTWSREGMRPDTDFMYLGFTGDFRGTILILHQCQGAWNPATIAVREKCSDVGGAGEGRFEVQWKQVTEMFYVKRIWETMVLLGYYTIALCVESPLFFEGIHFSRGSKHLQFVVCR